MNTNTDPVNQRVLDIVERKTGPKRILACDGGGSALEALSVTVATTWRRRQQRSEGSAVAAAERWRRTAHLTQTLC